MMYTRILFLFLLCWSTGLSAQQEETLLNKAKVHGGFGGPIFTYAKVKGNNGFGSGGGGAVLINNLFVGGFGQGETFDIGLSGNQDYRMNLGYGGIWLGYVFPTQRLLHFYGSLKLGAGGINYDERRLDPDVFDGLDDAVFVVTPEVGAELNLTHWFRLAGTIGYRVVDGFRGAPDLGTNALNAPVYGLTLRFGWFGHKMWDKSGR